MLKFGRLDGANHHELDRKKDGLVLGGGVRGLAHVGVFKVLEQEGIAIDLIVGTSAGALIGGAYAAGMTPREITAKVDAYGILRLFMLSNQVTLLVKLVKE